MSANPWWQTGSGPGLLSTPQPSTDSDSSADSDRTDRTDSARPLSVKPTAVPTVTHRIVTPDSGLANLAMDDTSGGPADEGEKLPRRGQLLNVLSPFRFFSEPLGSLRDQIEYAEDAAYSSRTDGWWRTAHIWYARSIVVVGLPLCWFLAWALFTRLSRALTAIPVILFALWALNQLPFTAWLIPNGLDFTTWFAPDDSVSVCTAPGPGR